METSNLDTPKKRIQTVNPSPQSLNPELQNAEIFVRHDRGRGLQRHRLQERLMFTFRAYDQRLYIYGFGSFMLGRGVRV